MLRGLFSETNRSAPVATSSGLPMGDQLSSVDFAPRIRCSVGDERTSIRVVVDCSREQPRGVRDGAWIP